VQKTSQRDGVASLLLDLFGLLVGPAGERSKEVIVVMLLRMSVFRRIVVFLSLLVGQGGVSRSFSAFAFSGTGIQPMRVAIDISEATSTSGQFAPLESEASAIASEKEGKLENMVNRFLHAIFQIDGLSWFGVAVVTAMLVFYNLETRSPLLIIAFAAACLMGSVYGYLHGSRTIVVVGLIAGILAPQKFWHQIKANNQGLSRTEHLAVVWLVRSAAILAVSTGVLALMVDSPMSMNLASLLNHSVAEAVPLVLVGIAYLAWLATERPPTVALIKQVLIAVAFVLWGINLLMPAGQWARFVGAVVIAIYVFDLVWLIEGNLRRTLRIHVANQTLKCDSPDSQSTGVCNCSPSASDLSDNGDERRWSGDAFGMYARTRRSRQHSNTPQKPR
jgi:hypothetical protein